MCQVWKQNRAKFGNGITQTSVYQAISHAIGDYAYKRTDGVIVVPAGTLKN